MEERLYRGGPRPVPCTDEVTVQSEQDYLHILGEQNRDMPVPAPQHSGTAQGNGSSFIRPQGNFTLTENGRSVTNPSD